MDPKFYRLREKEAKSTRYKKTIIRVVWCQKNKNNNNRPKSGSRKTHLVVHRPLERHHCDVRRAASTKTSHPTAACLLPQSERALHAHQTRLLSQRCPEHQQHVAVVYLKIFNHNKTIFKTVVQCQRSVKRINNIGQNERKFLTCLTKSRRY